MNREIKYRVWDTETKSFIGTDWLQIGIVPQGSLNIVDYTIEGWVNKGRAHRCIYQLSSGLTDSTGKEIYEGDIVHIGGWRYPRQVVKFSNGAYRGINRYVGEGYLIYELLKTNTVDIVGNIFENPESVEQ